MENKFKRFLSLLLALVMVIGMMPLSSIAIEGSAATETIKLNVGDTQSYQLKGNYSGLTGDATISVTSAVFTPVSITVKQVAASPITSTADLTDGVYVIRSGSAASDRSNKYVTNTVVNDYGDGANATGLQLVDAVNENAYWTIKAVKDANDNVTGYTISDGTTNVKIDNATTGEVSLESNAVVQIGHVSGENWEIYVAGANNNNTYYLNAYNSINATSTAMGYAASSWTSGGADDVGSCWRLYKVEEVTRTMTTSGEKVTHTEGLKSGSSYLVVNANITSRILTSTKHNDSYLAYTTAMTPTNFDSTVVWTLEGTVTDGSFSGKVKAADGQYLTFGTGADGPSGLAAADVAPTIDIVPGTVSQAGYANAWRIENSGMKLNPRSDGSVSTWGAEDDNGNHWYLYEIDYGTTAVTIEAKQAGETSIEIGGETYSFHVHGWNEGEVTTTPGCETEGVKTYTCTVNNCTDTKTESIPAAHTPGAEATCGTAQTCTVCGTELVSATGNHTPNEDDGNCTTAITCSVCNTVTTEGAAAHTPSEDDGDCTTDITCSECGTVTTEGADAHTPNADDGDCTTDITCSECGTVTTEGADAHSYESKVTPPTFEADGYTTYTCSECGHTYTDDVVSAKVAVAQIGDNKYESLAEAVAEANDGDTVTLLNNATGAGIVIDKDITIDLGGFTYTINSPVGSTGTETNGFQILENNTVTIQNGKLEVAAEYADKFYMLIQNYADLTVANVTLDGTNLDKRINIDNYSYVLSNNSGTVNITGDTSITANDEGGANAFALDACKYGSYAAPTVTVNTTGTIAGNIEVTGGNLDVQAATITGELVYGSGTVTKAEDVTLAAPADYKWDNGTLTAKTYVAQVGETKYESLAVAVAEAPAGSEVKLLSNTNGDGIVIDKDITIDLAGFTYTIDGTLVGSANTQSNGFQIKSGNTVTIKNGDIVMDEGAVRGHDGQTGRNFVIQNYANLTLENVDITGNNETTYVVSINSGDVAINGTTSITATKEGAVAFDVCESSSYAVPTVTVNTTGTITGKIEVTGGTLALNAATVSGNLVYESGSVTKADAVALTAPEGYEWVEGTLTEKVVEPELFDISFARMTLQSSLDMSFAFEAGHAEDWTGAYVQIVKEYADGRANVTQTISYSDWSKTSIGDVNHYYVTFNGIAAKEMTDNVYVTVYNAAGEAISDVWTDSVRDYAMRTLENPESTDKELTMIVDMLNYGAAAQEYFEYNIGKLATSELTEAQKALATQSAAYEDTRVRGTNYLGSNLELSNKIKLMMAFQNVDQDMYAVVTYTDCYGDPQTVTVEGSEFELNNGAYVVYIDCISVADARQDVTCEIYSGETVVAEATDSVESYVARMADRGTLFEMIVKFADSANAYLLDTAAN